MNSVDDCPRARTVTLTTNVLVLERYHMGLDLQDVPDSIQGILALCQTQFIFDYIKALLANGRSFLRRDLGWQPNYGFLGFVS